MNCEPQRWAGKHTTTLSTDYLKMLKANHPNGDEYLAEDVPHANFGVDDPHNLDWRCTVEGCPMQFVDSKRRVKHFRHDNERPDHPTPNESEAHKKLKIKLHNRYKNEKYVKAISVEHYLEDADRIADLAMWLISGQKLVIEIQLSNQGATKFEERTGDYNNQGFAVLWLVGEDNYIQKKQTKKSKGWAFKDGIKWLQKQYYGRFYAITDGGEIIPTRFEKKSRWVEETGYGGGYTKKYDTIAEKSQFAWHNLSKKHRPQIAHKNNDYWNGIRQYDIATFGESPWW